MGGLSFSPPDTLEKEKIWKELGLNLRPLALQATALTSNCSYLAKRNRAFGQMSGDSNIKSIQKNKVLGSTRNQKYFEFCSQKFQNGKKRGWRKVFETKLEIQYLDFFFFFFIKKLIFFLQRWRLLKKNFFC